MSAVSIGSSIGNHVGLGGQGRDPESGLALLESSNARNDFHLELYKAAVTGDWEMAQEIYRKHPEEKINAAITKRGETALHISALAEQSHFVKQLIHEMSEDELASIDKAGHTAFSVVAITKKVELADAMLKKNKNLAMIRHGDKMLPLSMAARLGHREMVSLLYEATKEKLEYEDRRNLLFLLIKADIYDTALEMLEQHKSLAIEKDTNGETALHALARKPHVLSSVSSQSWRIVNLLSGSKETQKLILLQKNALELVQHVWDRVKMLEDLAISRLIGSDWAPIFIAAEEGNLEFLRILIRSYPDIIFKLNNNRDRRTIFHIAVLHRHENVFKLIHEIGSIKNLIGMYEDNGGNNMLHLVGKVAPTNRLNVVPGAALQLQRELLWFEEVKKVVKPHLSKAKNMERQTPEELFLIGHMDLMEKGEKWMRDTATSCTLVATLIATVVFAAAFTVPGGTKQDNSGIPVFLHKATFKLFAVSDAISLIFATSSVLTFLSILTSRYRMDDFLWSLPNRLVVGLTTLFISIVAMMVAFIAAIFIVFKDGLLAYTVPVAVISPIPIVLFMWLHGLLFLDVIKSTYLHRSLFQPNRIHVFQARASRELRQNLLKRITAKARKLLV